MSHSNFGISNEQVIPTIESDVFRDRPDARFAVGIIAVGNHVAEGLEREYNAYYDLRRSVYLDQMGHLSLEDIDSDGTDRDMDDARSVAFGVIENHGHKQRLVAASRLIIKGMGLYSEAATEEPLPVEKDWPELFSRDPAPSTALEVSRLISRHESAGVQVMNTGQLFTAELGFVRAHNLGPAYGMVEELLERNLKRFVPIGRLRDGEPKYIPHYRSVNMPIEIDIPEFARKTEARYPGVLDTMPVTLGEMAYYGTLRKERAIRPIELDLQESA